MRFIIRFGQNYLTRIISDWMLLTSFCNHLTKNTSYRIVRDISLDLDLALKFENLEDWGLGKRLL